MDAKTGERGEHEAEEELRLLQAKVAGLPSEKGNETIARALPGVLFCLIPQGMVLHSFILLEILRFAAPSTKNQKHIPIIDTCLFSVRVSVHPSVYIQILLLDTT